jgi:hypothetical protein
MIKGETALHRPLCAAGAFTDPLAWFPGSVCVPFARGSASAAYAVTSACTNLGRPERAPGGFLSRFRPGRR